MFERLAIYRIPHLNHIFFILKDPDEDECNMLKSQCNRNSKEYFERIYLHKDNLHSEDPQTLTIVSIFESDFLSVLELHNPIKTESSNPSCHNPVHIEGLAINLLENPLSSDCSSLESPRRVNAVQDGDIIELWI